MMVALCPVRARAVALAGGHTGLVRAVLLTSALLLVLPAAALDPAATSAQASTFRAAGGGRGTAAGFVEVEPRFFVNVSDPDQAPRGSPAPDSWPLQYSLFREREVVTDLVAWLQANGVHAIGEANSAMNIEINYNTSARASGKSRADMRIVARRNVTKGEMFASVPLHMAVTADIADSTRPVGNKDQLLDFSILAAWLLRERAKGEASAWHPYIRALPQHIPVPFFYRDDLLALAEYPLLVNETADYKAALARQHEILGPEAVAHQNLSDFVWAFAAVTSRATYLPGEAEPASVLSSVHTVAGAAGSEGSEVAGSSPGSASGLSWEDEFLLDEDEAAELEQAGTDKKGGSEEEKGKEGGKEEDKEVPILVPLVDFFDWAEHPSATFEVVGSSLVFTATKDIAQGEPIFLQLPVAKNEDHLLRRAFVPELNEHDGALLFQSRVDAIFYFREKFLSGKFNENYRAVMDDTFEIAEEFIGHEVKKVKYRSLVGTSIEYSTPWDRNAPSFAWWGARMDVHHFAGIAAGHSITVHNKTPEYWDLAPAALAYAWLLRKGVSCDSLAEMLVDRESDSFPCAGTTVRFRIEDIRRGFNSTAQQDRNAFHVLTMCRELAVFGRTSTEEDFHIPAKELLEASCPEILVNNLQETEFIFKFRISKKLIYEQLLDRLYKTCELE